MVDERSDEERAEERSILLTRTRALKWAYKGNNMDAVRAEYRRRCEKGEVLLLAWRRSLWVCWRRNNEN
jgi:hypothetical protein